MAAITSSPNPLPHLSVIIPVYNGEADLPALLECLWAQRYPHDRVEYVIVDNGSHDRTAALLQHALPTARDRHITLHLGWEGTIQSSYAARNAGIRLAQADLLAFTDADCRPEPQWLTELVQPFADPQVGLVAGEILALPGSTALERYAERKQVLSQTHTLNHPFRPYGQTANLAVRRQALVESGLFRPYLTTGGDADLCWRVLQSQTWTIQRAERAIVRHRHRETLKDLAQQWRRYGRSNGYLHELHGIALMRDLPWQEYGYRIGRWLLKDVPQLMPTLLSGRGDRSRLMDTPLDLMCVWWRSQGQHTASLPERAKFIEPWISSEVDSPNI